jgi:hypothetical protein
VIVPAEAWAEQYPPYTPGSGTLKVRDEFAAAPKMPSVW